MGPGCRGSVCPAPFSSVQVWQVCPCNMPSAALGLAHQQLCSWCTQQTQFVRNAVDSPPAQDSPPEQDSPPAQENFKAPPPAQDVPRHHRTANFHPRVPQVFKIVHTWRGGRVVDASEFAMMKSWEMYHNLPPTFVFKNPPPPAHPPPPLHPPPGVQWGAKASEPPYCVRPPLVF